MVTLEHSVTGHKFFLCVIFTEPTQTIKSLNLKLAVKRGLLLPENYAKCHKIDNLCLNGLVFHILLSKEFLHL